MPLPQAPNYQEMQQGIDRITSILNQQSQPRTMSPIEPQASSLPFNILDALQYSKGDYMQNVQNYENNMYNQQRQQNQDLLSAYEAKLKLGDRQTKALDDKIKMFVGDDPEAKSTILQELHNLPEDINPESTDAYIKIAGIAKKHGLTNVERQLKLEKDRADIERSKALSSGVGGGGATGALADRLIAQGVDPLQAILIAKSGIDRGMIVDPTTGELKAMKGYTDILKNKKEKEALGSALGKAKGEKEGISATKIIQAPIIEERLNQAELLLPQATEGSIQTFGKGLAGAFGKATEGSLADAKLQVIAAELISNVPRMEGPQSDKDTMLYKQAAGNLADTTLPSETRMAALQQIREINNKYLNKDDTDWLTQITEPKPQNKIDGSVIDYKEYFK